MSTFYPFPVWRQEADATLSQASPTANTLYTVLDTTKNCRISSATASVTWTVQPTPLDLVFTIDGQTIMHTIANPVTATDYITVKSALGDSAAANAQVLHLVGTGYTVDAFPVQYEGKSIKVEARTGRTVAGTTSNLSARVKYLTVP
jgi:hypothetical protein